MATLQQQQQAFIKIVSNRKRHDKHSLGYFIGMIEGAFCIYNIYSNTYKREQLLEKLIALSQTEKGWNVLINCNYVKHSIKLELSETK